MIRDLELAAEETQSLPQVQANTARDAPPLEDFHDPEPQARDLIQSLIKSITVKDAMFSCAPRLLRAVKVDLDVMWPADLSLSPTPKGGLGSSSMTQHLMTDLRDATARSLVRLWLSTRGEDLGCHDFVSLRVRRAPTIVMLALAQGIRAASLRIEELDVKERQRRPRPLNLVLQIYDWPDDEPTQEPACCVLQNLIAALESGFVEFPLDGRNPDEQRIDLSNYNEPVSPCPARVELERLALRMSNLFPPTGGSREFHSYQLHGLHHVPVDSIKQELSKGGRALSPVMQVSFAPDQWQSERVSSGGLALNIPGDVAVMHYSIGASGDTEGLLQMLRSLKRRCAFHISLELRVVLDWEEVTGPGGFDYVEVRRCILDSITTWAGMMQRRVSIVLHLERFPSISDLDDVLRRCLPSTGNSQTQVVSWVQFGELVLDITHAEQALDELTEWNDDDSSNAALNATLSAVAEAGIQHLTFHVVDVEDAYRLPWEYLLETLEDLLEKTLESSVHMQDCRLEELEGDNFTRVQCAKFSCSCLERNRELALLIATLKQLVRAGSNPLFQEVEQAFGGNEMLSFHLLQYLLAVDTPIRPQVMAMCGCKPPAAKAAGPSSGGHHDQQTESELLSGSSQESTRSPPAVPQAAQAEEPEKEQNDTAADEDEGLQQAVAESTEAAVADYNGQLARAMQESVWEQPHPAQCVPKGPLDMESCMRFELTRCGGQVAEAVSDLVMHAPELEQQRQRVLDAGCQLRPSFAAGSLMLVPITEEMFIEAGPHPLEGKHYIYALPDDKDAINAALRIIGRKKRVRVKAPQAGSSTNAQQPAATAGSFAGAGPSVQGQAIDEVDEESVELVVKGTFLDMRIVRDKGCSASAPADLQSLRGPVSTE